MAQMLTCMDDLSAGPQPQEGAAAGGDGHEGGQEEEGQGGPGTKGFAPHPHVIVIGATNRPDALDPALRWVRAAETWAARGSPRTGLWRVQALGQLIQHPGFAVPCPPKAESKHVWQTIRRPVRHIMQPYAAA